MNIRKIAISYLTYFIDIIEAIMSGNRILVPGPFGLVSNGNICYLNSLLQVLVGCPSFTREILQNQQQLKKLETGKVLAEFVNDYSCGLHPVLLTEKNYSVHIISAIINDLRNLRSSRTRETFGSLQESVTEAFVFLIEILQQASDSLPNLFVHESQCELHCLICLNMVSRTMDRTLVFNLFHLDESMPNSDEEFLNTICRHLSRTEGYRCPNCGVQSNALRVYTLSSLSEILVCAFNGYNTSSMKTRVRYFPQELLFPTTEEKVLVYRLVGQIEHAGSLGGGHYWSRSLRQNGEVYLFDDMYVERSQFEHTENTYVIVYHYIRTVDREHDLTPLEAH